MEYTDVQSPVLFLINSNWGSWIPSSTASGTLSNGSHWNTKSSVVWETKKDKFNPFTTSDVEETISSFYPILFKKSNTISTMDHLSQIFFE